MGSLAVRAKFEPLRTLGAGSITSSFVSIGIPLINPARQFHLYNQTDALLVFSTDGVHDHFVLPPSGFYLNDLTSNKTQVHGLYLPTGGGMWVKRVGTPTTGSVYFSVMFGAEA